LPDRRPLVVNFWASTSNAAKTEIPVLNRISQEFKNRIRVVGVSAQNDDGPTVQRLSRTYGLKYPSFLANDALSRALFGTRRLITLPATFIFDGRGKLRRAFRRPVTERDIKLALDTGAMSAQDHMDLAMAAAAAKRFKPVRHHLAKALKLNPRSAIAWWRMGKLEVQEKHWPGAVVAFKKSNELVPNNVETMTELGRAYLETKDGARAVDLLKRVADKAGTAVSLLNLARAYTQQGQMALARASIEKAREKNPALIKKLQAEMKKKDLQAAPGILPVGKNPFGGAGARPPKSPWPAALQPQQR